MFGKLQEKVGQAMYKIAQAWNQKFSDGYDRLAKMKGYFIIRATIGGEEVYHFETPNVIVDSASTLIAQLLKESGTTGIGGIKYLALGTGATDWNFMMPPSPTPSTVKLQNEIVRKRVSYSQYVNPASGQPSVEPTNIVDYVFTFSEGEGVGPLVECGMFGGTATSTQNSGTMVNYRTFPVLNKNSDMAFSVVFRITT